MLNDAVAGQGGLVMLVGEAGIGKTWLAREVALQANRNAKVVLWGCCFEGDWQPAYGPWVEILQEYVRETDPGDLRRLLAHLYTGAGGTPLAQLVPQLCAVLPGLRVAPPLEPEEERLRHYDAVTQLLMAIAKENTVLLVIDDLHWADRDSLRLLRYLGRFAMRSRILLVGVYRESELGLTTQHALSELLPIMQRETNYRHIAVHGLGKEEVAEYLALAAGQRLPEALVQRIYEETSGNPFYVRELFEHLREEGKIRLRGGRWSTDFSIGELGVPAGVRQVVQRRLSRLSDNTNTLLRLAAGFGGGFNASVLQVLAEMPEEELLDCVDEALKAGLLRVVAGVPPTYDFAHAIVRHAVYEELNPDRRVRLHRRIANALERVHAGSEMEHAAELASQYHASAGLPDAAKGIRYALAAAEQAKAAYAHDRATRFLRVAGELAAKGEPAERAEILCKLALAEAETLMLKESPETAWRALDALREAGAAPRERAAFLAAVAAALKAAGAASAVWTPLVEEGLALIGDVHDLVWARLTLLCDLCEPVSNGEITVYRWLGHDPEAVEIARTRGDEEDYALTLTPYDWRSRQETEALLALAREWKRPKAIMRALGLAAEDLIQRHGEFREGEELCRQLLAIGEQYGSIRLQAEALFHMATAQLCSSDVALAQQTAQRAREAVERLGPAHWMLHAQVLGLSSTISYYVTGDWQALEAGAASFVFTHDRDALIFGLAPFAAAAFIHSQSGNAAEARRILSLIMPIAMQMAATDQWQDAVVDFAATAIWQLQLVELAAPCHRLALDLIAAGITTGPVGVQELNAARMAALLGNVQEAKARFEAARQALDVSGRRHVRAIVDFDEAQALLRAGSGERSRILALLDTAIDAFRSIGMPTWVRRALSLREAVDSVPLTVAVPERAYPDGLTSREVEVLRLIAAGKTNNEIAEKLVLSVRTVERHIANIYLKIEAHNRVEATNYALSQGLTP